jgi:Tol biopolymer transport system component
MPAGHADWSPDGERLAFDTEPEDGEQIWTVDADGTNAQVVMCAGAACGPAASPAWSPDGRYLLFNRALPREAGQEYDRVAIEVADLATGATRLVAASPVAGTEYVEYIGPRWSPDGTHIVFTVMRYPVPPTDENILGSSIATVAADGSDGDAPRVLTDPAMFGNYPDWSPDGERIVLSTYPLGSFPQTTKATNLYMIAPDGTGLTQVTRFGENDTRATQPTWTPDGQRIVFTDIERDPSDPYRRLVALIDADGSDLTLIQIPAAQVDEHGDKWFGTHARMRPSP